MMSAHCACLRHSGANKTAIALGLLGGFVLLSGVSFCIYRRNKNQQYEDLK